MENREHEEYRYAYEGALDRMHRTNKWLIIVIVILILSLVGTNLAWVIYESQFETQTTETEIEAWQDGDMNLVSGGDMYYGSNGEDKD